MTITMTSLLTFVEQLGARCLNLEVFLSLVALIFAYFFFIRSDALYDFVGKILVKLELKVTGHYDHVPVDGESIVSAHKTRASWEYRKDNVGVYAIQGRRPHMEDRFNVVSELEHTGTSIYGVFDGHGGEFAADYTEKTLFKILMVRLLKAELSGERLDLSALLTEEILNVDKQLLNIERSTGEISGTTALVALLRDNQLYVANVGDSRAVMCDGEGNTVPLSYDHKPQQVKERRRIKKAGGFISFNGVWRVAGILATSRALGDYPLKEHHFVIADPDVLTFDLNDVRPRFMIIASDGLWDAFSNEEAVNYIKDRLDEPHFGAKSIVLQAYYRGSLDNVTVMIVNFSSGTVAEACTEEVIRNVDEELIANAEEVVVQATDDMSVALKYAVAPALHVSASIPFDDIGAIVDNNAPSRESNVSFSSYDDVQTYSPIYSGSSSRDSVNNVVSDCRVDKLSIAQERQVSPFRDEQISQEIQEVETSVALKEVISVPEDEKLLLSRDATILMSHDIQISPPISREKIESSDNDEIISLIRVEVLPSILGEMKTSVPEDLDLTACREGIVLADGEGSSLVSRDESLSPSRKLEISFSPEESAAQSFKKSISRFEEGGLSSGEETQLSSSSEENVSSSHGDKLSSTIRESASSGLEEMASPTIDTTSSTGETNSTAFSYEKITAAQHDISHEASPSCDTESPSTFSREEEDNVEEKPVQSPDDNISASPKISLSPQRDLLT